MTTSGPNYASNSTNVAATGDGTWTNPGNVYSDNAIYATCLQDGGENGYTDILKNLGFGFAIPSGATINGITVEVDRKSSGISSEDKLIQLYKAGVLVGLNKASTTDYTTSDVTATYGGAADLWGTTWTHTDINSATFGIGFQSQQVGSASRTISVDFVRITIDYTEGGGGGGGGGPNRISTLIGASAASSIVNNSMIVPMDFPAS